MNNELVKLSITFGLFVALYSVIGKQSFVRSLLIGLIVCGFILLGARMGF